MLIGSLLQLRKLCRPTRLYVHLPLYPTVHRPQLRNSCQRSNTHHLIHRYAFLRWIFLHTPETTQSLPQTKHRHRIQNFLGERRNSIRSAKTRRHRRLCFPRFGQRIFRIQVSNIFILDRNLNRNVIGTVASHSFNSTSF